MFRVAPDMRNRSNRIDGGSRTGGWRATLDVVTAVALLLATVFVVWNNAPSVRQLFGSDPARTRIPVPVDPIEIEGAATKGSSGAKIAIVEFSDFECPFCGAFSREILPTLDRDYIRPGKVKLIFRHLPLQIHPFAVRAAQAAECAEQQGRFWPLHDLFSTTSLHRSSTTAV
jgi:hypothetical protein